jgi:hypothetical protein
MSERTFTDLELERSLAGDLDLGNRASDADRARLEQLRVEHAAFLGKLDVDAEVRAIGRRMAKLEHSEARPRKMWRWIVSAGALAAAAAAVLVLVRRPGEQAPDFQTKGDGVTLRIHVAAGSDSKQLASGDLVAPGSHIRFEIDAVSPGYVAVIGIDATGVTTVYYPYGGADAAAFDPRASRLIPGAIALDATPGDEHFFALYSSKPFKIPSITALPAGISQSEVVLKKNRP